MPNFSSEKHVKINNFENKSIIVAGLLFLKSTGYTGNVLQRDTKVLALRPILGCWGKNQRALFEEEELHCQENEKEAQN